MITSIGKTCTKDIQNIFDYISDDSIKYANLTTENINSRIADLEIFPFLGRMIPELQNQQYRELIYKNYRIVYKISECLDIIYILFIIHSKRNFYSYFNSYINKN